MHQIILRPATSEDAAFALLDKLYLLPAHQNRGHGSYLLPGLTQEASLAEVPLRLTGGQSCASL